MLASGQSHRDRSGARSVEASVGTATQLPVTKGSELFTADRTKLLLEDAVISRVLFEFANVTQGNTCGCGDLADLLARASNSPEMQVNVGCRGV